MKPKRRPRSEEAKWRLTPPAHFSTLLESNVNMTCLRQRKINPMLRICAALMLLVWVAASGFCSVEPLFAHAKSSEHDSGKTAHHQDEAVPSSTDSGHSHDSDKHDDGEHSCCASLTATPQSGGFVGLTKPDFGKLLSLDFIWLAQVLTFVQPETPSPRQTRAREWVFTPEVFLGPAFRSHAPPLAFI